MLEPPTGWQFVLERPGQRAVVTEVGAALRSWRVRGQARLDGFDVASAGEGCRVRAPWPARDALLAWVNWRPVRRTCDRLALGYVLHPQPGYEHTVGVEVESALAPDGLEVELRATNLGDEPAPFAAGFHPCVLAGAGDVSLWTDGVFRDREAKPCGPGVTLAVDAAV